MKVSVNAVMKYMDELAPLSVALPGDPVGLQVGNPSSIVDSIMVALDPDLETIEEAIKKKAQMIITHHPLIYNKLSSINEAGPRGSLVARAIRNNLHIYSAHTNFDVTRGGVSYRLAEALGLPVKNASVLEVTGSEQLLKLVVFVPKGHEDRILDALARAGAGQIGRYSHCTFQTMGTGTFMPAADTNPFIGSKGELEKVSEIRLETILPVTRRKTIISDLIKHHPYEEVAYDLYPLDLEGDEIGLGLLIDLEEELSFEQLINRCLTNLPTNTLRYSINDREGFRRIALCGGSGGSLIEHAARQNADVLISGDFRYHDLKDAQALNIALIDAGHHATELPGVKYLKDYLQHKLEDEGYGVEVHLQALTPAGWSCT